MKNNKYYLSNSVVVGLLFSLVSFSCGDQPKKNSPEISAPTNIVLRDKANFGDGRDFGFSFVKPTEIGMIEAYRVFIVPEDISTTFDLTAALETDSYLKVGPGSQTSNLSLRANETDITGDDLSDEDTYVLFVLSKAVSDAKVEGALSVASNSLKLSLNNVVRTLTQSRSEGSGGMDIDDKGIIYMADFGAATNQANGNKVLKITPEGQVSVFATGLNGASGNDFDNDGNLYQSNIAGNTVSKITPDGEVSTFATGFSAPVGIVFDGESTFYVCNCGNNTISKVEMTGNVTFFSSSQFFNCPNGIDIDGQGNLYVANFASSTLVKITPDGTSSAFTTMPGNNNGHLLINGADIYVISRGLNQIHKVKLSNGQVSLFAGSGDRGVRDGSLREAGFSLPNDLAFSEDGKYIYVNDVNGGNPNQAVISPTVIRVIELVE